MGTALCGPEAGFTGEYLDLFNRGQWSTSWTIQREAVRCAGIAWGRHGGWIAEEQNVHMRNVKKMISKQRYRAVTEV